MYNVSMLLQSIGQYEWQGGEIMAGSIDRLTLGAAKPRAKVARVRTQAKSTESTKIVESGYQRAFDGINEQR